jgi:hypothetical protein
LTPSRKRARHAHRLHLGHQLAAVERDLEEVLQPGEGRVQRDRRGPLIDQVQLEATQILDSGGVGRASQEGGQIANGADVGFLRLVLQFAHAHVVDHALALRRDGLSRGVHGSAPVEERGGLPRSSTSQNQRRNELPRDSR